MLFRGFQFRVKDFDLGSQSVPLLHDGIEIGGEGANLRRVRFRMFGSRFAKNDG